MEDDSGSGAWVPSEDGRAFATVMGAQDAWLRETLAKQRDSFVKGFACTERVGTESTTRWWP